MRKFLTIFSFCFIFTILYSTDIFAVSRTELPSGGKFCSVVFDRDLYSEDTYGNRYFYIPSNFTQGVFIAPFFCIYPSSSNLEEAFFRIFIFSTDRDALLNAPIFYSSDDVEYNLYTVSTLPSILTFNPDTFVSNGVTYYYIQYHYSWAVYNGYRRGRNYVYPTLNNFDFYSRTYPDVSDFLNANLFEGLLSVFDISSVPIPSSDLDFKNVQVFETNDTVPGNKTGFLGKFLDWLGSAGAIQSQPTYLLPNYAISWSQPSYSYNYKIDLEYRVKAKFDSFILLQANRVNLVDGSLSPPAYQLDGVHLYNSDFNDLVSISIFQLIPRESITNEMLSNGLSGSVTLQVLRIRMTAYSDEFIGAETTIDFTGGTPKVFYGVTDEDLPDVPTGDWSYDITDDIDSENNNGDIIYKNKTVNNYNYNYNYGDNHYDTDGFISSFWSIIKSVGTLLGRLSSYLALIFLGASSAGTVFAPIFLLIGLAVGIAVAMRIIEIISGG